MAIPFTQVFLDGSENSYLQDCLNNKKIGGSGKYTNLCLEYLNNRFGFSSTILTPSCTDAIEMCSILLNFDKDNEIILPSFSFVSCALPFVLRGSKIIFADSCSDNPNIDADKLEELITPKTKAIFIIHYGGYPCDLEKIISLCSKYNIFLIEDAAHAVNSFYKGKALGSFGTLSVFSFHETKNISCGEGGLLVANDSSFYPRAEILRDKGTNRSAFFQGKVDKYTWVDVGSSFVQSDLLAALLYSQFQLLDLIQQKRLDVWNVYYDKLSSLEKNGICSITKTNEHSTNNAHVFYLVCNDLQDRINLTRYLKSFDIQASFHYQSLHASPFFAPKHDGRPLVNSDKFSNQLLRLPLYSDLKTGEAEMISDHILTYYKQGS
jgi:dTDP-4-amino-4,6-dideoxygalactose transaminase